ncbi:MAG: YkgJ family cysteine cluster protein [Bacteriovorax sp.]
MMKKPIESLQENASGFFDKVQGKHASKMACTEGCSKCCYTDISIFQVEGERIREWFNSQDEVKQSELKSAWKNPVQDKACAFLYDDRCTIYEARPVICRTQGAPLFLQEENVLDYCPLNFKEGDPPKEDWLNLDRLNTLLSFAAKTSGLEKRITLKKLKQELSKV